MLVSPSQQLRYSKIETDKEIILSNRFWSKVRTSNIHFYNNTPCLEWMSCTDEFGYGRFCLNGKTPRAHCVSYEYIKGEIPEGLELDHLCRNPSCVNPDHLEAVTHKENMRRGMTGFVTGLKNHLKTHCPQGHEYDKKNTYIRSKGNRSCRNCDRIRVYQYKQRKKMESIITIG